MVEYSKISEKEKHLNLVFHALSDHTRRSLLDKVKHKPRRVTDLAGEYDCSLNAISKHLKVLEKANLITRIVEGRVHHCVPNPKELVRAQKWINTYTKLWTERLDQLEQVLMKKQKKEKE